MTRDYKESLQQKIDSLYEEISYQTIIEKRIDETSDEPIDYAYEQADFDDKWQGFGTADY